VGLPAAITAGRRDADPAPSGGARHDGFESQGVQAIEQTRQLLLGKKSGLVSIEHKLKELGLTVDGDQSQALLEQVKAVSTRKRGAITDAEFREIVGEVG